MKIMKKIVAMTIAFAMLFSCIAIAPVDYVSAATDVSTWQSTAIISPEQGKLIGAGYIDVKWNNSLDNVKQYKVYVDGALKKTVAPNGETMSCEFYTVAVKAHTAQIVAELNDGSSVKTDLRTFYVTKKGICVNTKDMGAALDPADLNLGWYYNWGYKSFKDLAYKNKKFYDLEFVPMLYGDAIVDIAERCAYADRKGYKYILSYNEPDLSVEANIQPGTMVYRWRDTIANKGNMKVGSPAISTATPIVESTKWWNPFWSGLTSSDKANMTFIAVHKYYENYNAQSAYEFLMLLDETYYKYRKPMWITEFALWNADKNNAQSNKNAQEFLKIVCKGMNERSYVERYSWFCPNYRETSASASSLWDYETGNLTTIGKMYAQIGNPAGYNAKTYGVSSSISANTSVEGCIAKQKTSLYDASGKKKSFRYSLKTIKRAAGYQIKYGTNKSLKGAKIKTVKKPNGTVKITFTKKQKKLIKKKPKKYKTIKYYVRARAYKVINGKKMYYSWSNRLTSKVKTK